MSAAPSGRGAFLSDIETLRRRAREHIAQGAVTPGYPADDLASLLEDFPGS